MLRQTCHRTLSECLSSSSNNVAPQNSSAAPRSNNTAPRSNNTAPHSSNAAPHSSNAAPPSSRPSSPANLLLSAPPSVHLLRASRNVHLPRSARSPSRSELTSRSCRENREHPIPKTWLLFPPTSQPASQPASCSPGSGPSMPAPHCRCVSESSANVAASSIPTCYYSGTESPTRITFVGSV
ncbi:uncharacterized protein [Notamacropus eugenii]|uniref:uncharacterized protein isoform X2 n=1 Tax=Notamacropus eugenii TaxID=9315 RepID=UPI003B67E8E8